MRNSRLLLLILVFAALFVWAPGEVLWAEPVIQPVSLEAIGVRDLAELDPELTGSAVILGLVELCQSDPDDQGGYAFMPNFEHRVLASTQLEAFYYYQNRFRPVCYSTHAGMIAAILFGDDENAQCDNLDSFSYRGIVPQAAVEVYETNWFIYNRAIPVEPEFTPADILSISWGTDADDLITMWWQRGIDALAVRDQCLIVAACGNGTGQHTAINKPSWGHNVISVAAAASLGQMPDCLRYVGPPAEYSSCGPTDDDRAKPDIIAPGLAIGPQGRSDYAYYCDETANTYSSFAAPHVGGVAALLIDAARKAQIAHGAHPLLIRALLLNGANKLIGWHKGTCDPNDDYEVPLDYRQGAGLVDAVNSYHQLRAGPVEPNKIEANIGWDLGHFVFDANDANNAGVEEIYYLPEPISPEIALKATLTWYRHYKQDRLHSPLPLNTLALELWSTDQKGNLRERLDYSASLSDNVQHIYYHSGTPQKVALRITAQRALPNGPPEETYALAFCSQLENFPGDQMPADFNANGIVDVNDLLRLLDVWQGQADGEFYAACLIEDLNADGRVNEYDFDLLTSQWQVKSPWYHPEN